MINIIIKCENQNLNEIFEYIGNDYGKCLYIFIDLKKYGIDDENFNVWIQYNDKNEIVAVMTGDYYFID